MELTNINKRSQHLFFSCLWPDIPRNDYVIQSRREWYSRHINKGYEAKVLIDDNGAIVGKCQTIPVEYSPLIGNDLMIILCLYVHMYDQYIGDQRGKGYGRYMLKEVENLARIRGYSGVATWAMDWHWNPKSFYEHMGYEVVDRIDKAVVLWKPFHNAIAPRFYRLHQMAGKNKKINVFVGDNAWCDGNQKTRIARKAIEGIERMVEYHESFCPCHNRMLHLGHVGGVFLDGEPYKPYELIGDPVELRQKIIELYQKKV